MYKKIKLLVFTTLVAVMGFSFIGCGNCDDYSYKFRNRSSYTVTVSSVVNGDTITEVTTVSIPAPNPGGSTSRGMCLAEPNASFTYSPGLLFVRASRDGRTITFTNVIGKHVEFDDNYEYDDEDDECVDGCFDEANQYPPVVDGTLIKATD